MDYSDDAISAHPARCNRKISNKWTKEEDQRLLELIGQHDMTDTKKGKIWVAVSEGLAPRTAKQCRERYVNNIDPNRKKGNWTAEEDEIIFKLVDDLGTKWSKISALLPGRTDNDVKNRYHTKNEQSPFHPSQYYAKKRKPEGTPASNNPKKKPRISIKLSSTPSTEKKVESKSDDPTYFPNKLMNILESADPSIVSWVADGDAFIIRDKDRFANSICPQYFKHSKFRAFQRSLSQYGFRRISDGDNKGAYQHEKFKRDQPWLSAQMKSMPRDDRMKKSDAIKSIRDSFNTPGGIDPQIGMRVQVKYMGVAQGGVIEHVYKHPHAPFWNLTIRFDNGERGENVYPGQFIKLIPKKSQITPIHFGSDAASKQEYPSKTSNLNESEVALCHELIGMAKSSSSDDMSKSSAPDTDREELKNQCSGEEQEEEEEEYEDYLYEYLAMKAKGEFDSVHQKESDAQESSSEQQESTDDESGSYNPTGGDAIDLLSGKIFNSTTKQRAKKEKKKRDEDEFKDTCNIEGCKNTAQRGGRCIKHGGKYISKKERARLGLDVNTKRNRRPSLKVKANQGGDNTGLYSETRRRQAHSIHDGQPENKAEGIADVGPHDVLVGRGGLTNHNPGNIKWRNIVEILKPEYKAASRANKAHIAMSIVKEWRRLEPPGRFLKRDDETGLWSDIGDVDARIKCSQVLRENKGTKLKLDEFGNSCGGKNSAPDLSTVIGGSPQALCRSSLDSHESSTKSDSEMKPQYSSDHSPDSSTYTMEDEAPSHNYGSRSRTSGFRKKYEEGPDSDDDSEYSDMPSLDLSKPKSTKKVKNKYLISGEPIKSKKASVSKKKKKKPINKRMEITLIGDADDPTLQDVLLGRGGGTNGHPGNARFRDESRKLRSVYEASAREDKKQISLDLVDTVHAYGGRFMRQEQDGKWYEVDHESARKKCSQALRENKWN